MSHEHVGINLENGRREVIGRQLMSAESGVGSALGRARGVEEGRQGVLTLMAISMTQQVSPSARSLYWVSLMCLNSSSNVLMMPSPSTCRVKQQYDVTAQGDCVTSQQCDVTQPPAMDDRGPGDGDNNGNGQP